MTWWMLVGLWFVGFVIVHFLSPKGWSRATTQIYAAVTFLAALFWYSSPEYRPLVALLAVYVAGIGALNKLGPKGSFANNLVQAWWFQAAVLFYCAFLATDADIKRPFSTASIRGMGGTEWAAAAVLSLFIAVFSAAMMTGLGAAGRRTKAAVTAKGAK